MEFEDNNYNKKITKRPKCICNHDMKLVHYQGYYDSLSFWECHNEKCTINVESLKADVWRLGSYG